MLIQTFNNKQYSLKVITESICIAYTILWNKVFDQPVFKILTHESFIGFWMGSQMWVFVIICLHGQKVVLHKKSRYEVLQLAQWYIIYK